MEDIQYKKNGKKLNVYFQGNWRLGTGIEMKIPTELELLQDYYFLSFYLWEYTKENGIYFLRHIQIIL